MSDDALPVIDDEKIEFVERANDAESRAAHHLPPAPVSMRDKVVSYATLFLTATILVAFVMLWVLLARSVGKQNAYGFSGLALVKRHASDRVALTVGRLESRWHPNEPLDYYRANPGCRPYEAHGTVETLSQLLNSESFSPSDYELYVRIDTAVPKLLCQYLFKNSDELDNVKHAIVEDYRLVWLLDGRYAFTEVNASGGKTRLKFGVPLGEGSDKIYTHMDIIVHMAPADTDTTVDGVDGGVDEVGVGVITGLQVQPSRPMRISLSRTYNSTYTVRWIMHANMTPDTPLPWDSSIELERPSAMMRNSLLNFFVSISVTLVIVVGMILYHYHCMSVELAAAHAEKRSTKPITHGWFLLVNRAILPPRHGQRKLFIVLMSSGVQLSIQCLIVAAIGMFGLIGTNLHGEFFQAVVVSYVIAHCITGAISGALFSQFYVEKQKARSVWRAFVLWMLQAFFVWGIAFGILIPIVIYLNIVHSSNALSWVSWTWLSLASACAALFNALFFVIGWRYFLDTDNAAAGGVVGVGVAMAARMPQIDRAVVKDWVSRSIALSLVFGFLSSASLALPLYYLARSYAASSYLGVTLSMFTWVFGSVVFGIVYFYWQLKSNIVFWWWEAYISLGASSCGYLFIYALCYFLVSTHIRGFFSTYIFFSYLVLFLIYTSLAVGGTAVFAAYVAFSYVARSTEELVKLD